MVTAMFIAFAYLISTNNERAEDSISVLFAVSCIYLFFCAFRAIYQFSPNEESPALVYSLPLKKSSFYFSVFIPAMGWSAGVMTSIAVLILISGIPARLAGLFLLESLFAATVFLLVATNYALASYPDVHKAKKYFVYYSTAEWLIQGGFHHPLSARRQGSCHGPQRTVSSSRNPP